MIPIKEFLEAKIEEGFNEPKKLRALATLSDYKNKEIEDTLKELGYAKARNKGYTYHETLAWLAEEARTEKELFELVLEEGTKNEARWIRDRNKIRELFNDIFKRFDKGLEVEELASKELKEEVKEKGK